MGKQVKPYSRRSLQKRLVIVILLASSVMTAVFTGISFYLDYRVEMGSLESTFKNIQHSSLDSIAGSLYDFNSDLVNTQIQGVLGISEITAVQVFDEQGKIYAQAKASDEKAIIKSYVGLDNLFDGHHSVKIYPLMDPKFSSHQIGTLVVEASQRDIFVRLSNKALYFFLTQGLKTLCVSLIIMGIFDLFLTKHLQHVVRHLQTYNFETTRAGEPLALDRIPPAQPDELDALVESVNTMAERLSYFNSKIQQQFHQKEREVRDHRAVANNVAKLATLGEMAGGIAHEINNPLHIIKGYTDILVDQLGQGEMNREVLHRASLVIDKNTGRIARIVTGLLMFSQRGNPEVFEPINISKLIDQVSSITQPLVDSHGITFIADLAKLDEERRVVCNHVQIAQVLINLINNAVDATTDSKLSEPWIRCVAESRDEGVSIRVIDSGHGISDELVHRIFEPFFTTREVGKGTGLGLSVSLGIVEQHKGRLYLDKKQPHTCFVLELPYKPSVTPEVEQGRSELLVS